MTDRYAVIGNPISHSKSPRIHGLFAHQTGQDLSYEALLAPLDDFPATVQDFIAAGGRGCNVTVPFKEQAYTLAKKLTPRARAAGAVNTLSVEGGKLVGDNTDGAGLLTDITQNLGATVAGKRVLLLGAGGAARGVVMPLLEQVPAGLTIANRTATKAEALAREFSSIAAFIIADPALQKKGGRPPQLPLLGGGYEDFAGRQFDIVINATSAGLSDAELPIDISVFAPGALAYDMMYGRETPFMRLAAEAGVRCADGLGMLVEQAAEAFFVWRGVRPQTAPVIAEMRSA